MSHWSEFDYVVVNDDFERATGVLGRIVTGSGEDLRAQRTGLRPLVDALLDPA